MPVDTFRGPLDVSDRRQCLLAICGQLPIHAKRVVLELDFRQWYQVTTYAPLVRCLDVRSVLAHLTRQVSVPFIHFTLLVKPTELILYDDRVEVDRYLHDCSRDMGCEVSVIICGSGYGFNPRTVTPDHLLIFTHSDEHLL